MEDGRTHPLVRQRTGAVGLIEALALLCLPLSARAVEWNEGGHRRLDTTCRLGRMAGREKGAWRTWEGLARGWLGGRSPGLATLSTNKRIGSRFHKLVTRESLILEHRGTLIYPTTHTCLILDLDGGDGSWGYTRQYCWDEGRVAVSRIDIWLDVVDAVRRRHVLFLPSYYKPAKMHASHPICLPSCPPFATPSCKRPSLFLDCSRALEEFKKPEVGTHGTSSSVDPFPISKQI